MVASAVVQALKEQLDHMGKRERSHFLYCKSLLSPLGKEFFEIHHFILFCHVEHRIGSDIEFISKNVNVMTGHTVFSSVQIVCMFCFEHDIQKCINNG